MTPTREAVIEYLKEDAGRPLKTGELARALEVPEGELEPFEELLSAMEGEGLLYRVKGQRYAIPRRINLVVGRLQTIRSGSGFVVTPEEQPDVFVPEHRFGSAINGDRVIARVERTRRDQKPEGRIIKVLERAHETIVGVYHPAKNFGFVHPETPGVNTEVFVPPGASGDASDGDVVVVAITSWGDGNLNPAGEVEKVLGPMTEPGVDVLTVLYGHGLPLDFPDEVKRAASDVVAEKGRPKPGAERTDRRDLHLFTIDPSDAKDHDDALSVTPLDDGRWEVGVHIADVSHYVDEGSTLDAEAIERGFSVYLVDRVVPMLPHELSSDLCSLRPEEDRYAVSLFIELDGEARVHGHRLERTLIRSRHRLSYEEVQEVLEGDGGIDPETDQALSRLRKLARQLRGKREERGSLDFDLPEARVILGDEGEPVDIQRVLRLESHRLIEEFMLLANETIARKARDADIPFLYRIHEDPPDDSFRELRQFLASIGYPLPGRGAVRPKDLQRILERVDGEAEENLVNTVILRSMQRARYATEHAAHFGLATEWYTHFTSPIRRYPDLTVHRLLIRIFVEGDEPGEEDADALEEGLQAIAERSSERERLAQDAERDSVELKKVEFMERHLGDTFQGTISGVTSFGLFVLLDAYFVEGLVHVSSLEDDYYQFIEDQYSLLGERTGRRFRLGDRVEVQVAAVNLEERKIDFRLADA